MEEDRHRKYLRVFLEACHRHGVLTAEQHGRLYYAIGDNSVLRVCSLASYVERDAFLSTCDVRQIRCAAHQIVDTFERHSPSLGATHRTVLVNVASAWLTVAFGDKPFASTAFTRIARNDASFMAFLEGASRRHEIRGGGDALLRTLVAYAQ